MWCGSCSRRSTHPGVLKPPLMFVCYGVPKVFPYVLLLYVVPSPIEVTTINMNTSHFDQLCLLRFPVAVSSGQ